MGHWESNPEREIHSIPGLSHPPQNPNPPKKKQQEKAQINNLTLHSKGLEKEQKTKIQMSRRKEVIKVRAEANKMES